MDGTLHVQLTGAGWMRATERVTGSVVTATAPYSSLYIGNWINGPGFDLPGGAPGPVLALNGPEDFTLSFTHGVTKIGLPVSTGLSNANALYGPQTDFTGAVFQVTTNNGGSGIRR